MISSASASEINETQTLSLPSDMSDNNDDVLSVENVNESSADKNSENLLGESNGNSSDLLGADAGTFAELQTIITNARSWDTITLDRDYVGSGTQLTINKPLTIDGNGYTLDADGKSRIFYITGENVTLKNISMKGGYANSQSGIVDKNRRPGGGFIYVNNVGTIVDSCIFNQTTGSGGAIAVMRSDF